MLSNFKSYRLRLKLKPEKMWEFSATIMAYLTSLTFPKLINATKARILTRHVVNNKVVYFCLIHWLVISL